MKVFELHEVSSKPRRTDYRYTNFKIYNNSLYMEAECNVTCNLEEDIEDISDEEFNKLVEIEVENILETLKAYGRYPETGIPKYVAY